MLDFFLLCNDRSGSLMVATSCNPIRFVLHADDGAVTHARPCEARFWPLESW